MIWATESQPRTKTLARHSGYRRESTGHRAASKIGDDVGPEGDRAGISLGHSHGPRAWKPIPQKKRCVTSDARPAIPPQDKKLGDVEHVGIGDDRDPRVANAKPATRPHSGSETRTGGRAQSSSAEVCRSRSVHPVRARRSETQHSDRARTARGGSTEASRQRALPSRA